jgi:hypothetical protein
VTNTAAAAASGFSVRVSFTPSNALRLQSPGAAECLHALPQHR